VLLADDNSEVRKAIVNLLECQFQIVGSGTNGQQAVDSAIRLNPDIVLLDISMPILNGMQVASRMQKSRCAAKLIFLTVHEDEDYVEAAFSKCALGYVLKRHMGKDLIRAIREALQGRRFTSKMPQQA
jgi:DNA-binding NarL/FixJ family response regulator